LEAAAFEGVALEELAFAGEALTCLEGTRVGAA
jgi:hypothetical protein